MRVGLDNPMKSVYTSAMGEARARTKALRAPEGKQDDIEYWKDVVSRQLKMLKSYKARQESIVIGLAYLKNNPKDVDVVIPGLLDEQLAVSVKRFEDKMSALKVAVVALAKHEDGDALEAIRALVPDVLDSLEEGK